MNKLKGIRNGSIALDGCCTTPDVEIQDDVCTRIGVICECKSCGIRYGSDDPSEMVGIWNEAMYGSSEGFKKTQESRIIIKYSKGNLPVK